MFFVFFFFDSSIKTPNLYWCSLYFSGLISHRFSICSKHSKHIQVLSHPRIQLDLLCHCCFLLLLPPVSPSKKTSSGPLRISLAIDFSWNPYLILIFFFLSVQSPPPPPYITTPRPCLCTVFAGLPIYLSFSQRFPEGKDFDVFTSVSLYRPT